jgi:ATP-dependent HslUV protease ATP-binding subunit HslU
MTDFSPREIVSELDRYIVGQGEAKRAVAIALRNRWRRAQLQGPMREEVLPKNILMIGPTGCGKTEIARRLAKLAQAPFLKVEATKFTEVGYVGRDVEQIVRDLVEVAISLGKEKQRASVRAKAEIAAEERLITALVGANAAQATRESFRRMLRAGDMEDKDVEIETTASGSSTPFFELPNMPGAVGAISLGDLFGKGAGKATRKRLKVRDAREPLITDEAEKLVDNEQIIQAAVRETEEHGIVFIDEIDKICVREGRGGGDVSREGVQRDLLPLIEGTTVATKHGAVRTDHILFIASGAFHISKPSDLLPELQGRLPIRVELAPLTEEDFKRILTETEASLPKQYLALMQTEDVQLDFRPDGIAAIAGFAARINSTVENIGARRLQTVMERILEDISFNAPDMPGETVVIDAAFVERSVGELARNVDLSRFIL